MSAPARRRRRAVAALALLLVAVLAVDAVGRAVRPGVLREAAVLAVDGAAASREPPMVSKVSPYTSFPNRSCVMMAGMASPLRWRCPILNAKRS